MTWQLCITPLKYYVKYIDEFGSNRGICPSCGLSVFLFADSFSQGEPRVLGLAMIPGHHVVSIEVESESLVNNSQGMWCLSSEKLNSAFKWLLKLACVCIGTMSTKPDFTSRIHSLKTMKKWGITFFGTLDGTKRLATFVIHWQTISIQVSALQKYYVVIFSVLYCHEQDLWNYGWLLSFFCPKGRMCWLR